MTTNTLDANIAKAVCEALAFESPKKIGWDDSKKMGACYSTCMNANERLRSNVFSYTIATGNIPSEHPAHTDNDIFYDAVEFNDNYKRALIENASMKATHQLTRDGGDHERDNRKRGGSVHEMQDDGSNISPASVTAIGTSAVFSQPPPPPRKAPPPPTELPLRFLRAGKGDPIEGQRRYEETLKWRDEKKMNETLSDAHPHFELIKKYYPHFFHLRGRNNEPVYFEKPAQTNLKALRAGGVDINTLLRHLAMVTEFNWQYVENDDFARNIYVIDLEGIRITDFVGECVEFLKKASKFTGAHYPERAGFVMVINVPSWFKSECHHYDGCDSCLCVLCFVCASYGYCNEMLTNNCRHHLFVDYSHLERGQTYGGRSDTEKDIYLTWQT